MLPATSDVLDTLELQLIWDCRHKETPLCPQPEPGLTAFCEFLQRILPAGSAFLDLGCGRGRNARLGAEHGFVVHGCDISPAALRLAAARAQEVGLESMHVVADLMRLPYSDDLFLAAACIHVLPYFLQAQSERVVTEIRRVLRPGGWLYADLLDPGDIEFGCGAPVEAHTFCDSDGIPMHFHSRQEIDELLSGFHLARVNRLEINGQAGVRVSWVLWAEKPQGA
jgi:ubiquinone/menaquinone biosynthesis C-methylase UbiE